MEMTYYFVLGVLSVFALILIGVITWGLLMINKQQTQIKNLQEDIQGLMRTISTEMEYTSRRIDNERQNIHSDLREYNNRMESQVSDIWRQIESTKKDTISESNSYVDKRIDKLIDAYFDIKKNKDLLKG